MGRSTLLRSSLGDLPVRHPHLTALLLFGSRARGEALPGSDWDLGYLADAGFRPEDLLANLVEALHDERVDLVDLDRASAVLRFQAARDGITLFERAPGAVDAFRLGAAHFWCEAGPLIRREQEWLLSDLREGEEERP